MPDDNKPYVSFQPRTVINAEDMNAMQTQIKADMQARIKTAKEEITKAGVDIAKDAEKFAGKTPEDLKGELDKRYAPIGQSQVSKYLRRFVHLQKSPVVIEHKFGRFPQVQLLQLLPLIGKTLKDNTERPNGLFYLYYKEPGEEFYGPSPFDAQKIVLVRATRGHVWGWPLKDIFNQEGFKYDLKGKLDDAVFDFRNDVLVRNSNIGDERILAAAKIFEWRDKTIGELIDDRRWDDIYFAYAPREIAIQQTVKVLSNANPPVEEDKKCSVDLLHLNGDSLIVSLSPDAEFGSLDAVLILRS
ncbi:unnamed protein product [Gemmata massiliana]|uniref:Uncharacterized protein n=2 Tax=Gemmata massiliana TaxID=1210884 RepID=A0A6P2CX21_9BACT|nr:unnamed protein product [Gemmata massiliana]